MGPFTFCLPPIYLLPPPTHLKAPRTYLLPPPDSPFTSAGLPKRYANLPFASPQFRFGVGRGTYIGGGGYLCRWGVRSVFQVLNCFCEPAIRHKKKNFVSFAQYLATFAVNIATPLCKHHRTNPFTPYGCWPACVFRGPLFGSFCFRPSAFCRGWRFWLF